MTSSTGTGAPTGKMRPDTAKSRLAAAVLALAAGIGSASAAWDGQSWVYDTSGRVDSSPSQEIGTLEEDFNSIFRTFEASPGWPYFPLAPKVRFWHN